MLILKRYVLALLFLLVSLINLVRAGVALYIAPALVESSLSISLPFLIGFYGLWGLTFLGMLIFCWQRRNRCYAWIVALVYQISLWIVRFVGDRADYARALWPRDAVLTVLFLAIVAGLVGARQKALVSES